MTCDASETVLSSTLMYILQMVIVYASDHDLLQDLQKEKEVSEKNKKDKDKAGNDLAAAAAAAAPGELDLDYYHSGLTPPTTNIVKRRFQETRMHGPYPVGIYSRREMDVAYLHIRLMMTM